MSIERVKQIIEAIADDDSATAQELVIEELDERRDTVLSEAKAYMTESVLDEVEDEMDSDEEEMEDDEEEAEEEESEED